MKRNENFQLVDRFHWSVSIGCFKKFHQFIKGVSDCVFWEVTPIPPTPKGFVWLEHLRSSTRSTKVCLWGYAWGVIGGGGKSALTTIPALAT